MQRKEKFLPFFFIFFTLSIFIIFLGKLNILGGIVTVVGKISEPARKTEIAFFNFGALENKTIKGLEEENKALRKTLLDQKKLESENKALKDQFQTTLPSPISLLPAKVVGSPAFIPGLTSPEYLVLDKGEKEGVRTGDSVVVGNNLIGKIVFVSLDFSKVELITNKNALFTVKIKDNISGIIKGRGNSEMLLDNVLLTQSINKDDLVLTKGEKDENGIGYSPDLVVGKLLSVEKKPSELFQRGAVKSLLDFTKLNLVYVLK